MEPDDAGTDFSDLLRRAGIDPDSGMPMSGQSPQTPTTPTVAPLPSADDLINAPNTGGITQTGSTPIQPNSNLMSTLQNTMKNLSQTKLPQQQAPAAAHAGTGAGMGPGQSPIHQGQPVNLLQALWPNRFQQGG